MSERVPYWYLASYPQSGNTWCREFITELRRLAGLDSRGPRPPPSGCLRSPTERHSACCRFRAVR